MVPAVDVHGPTPVSEKAKATASNTYQNQAECGPEKAVDGNPETRWATDAGTHQAWLNWIWAGPSRSGTPGFPKRFPSPRRHSSRLRRDSPRFHPSAPTDPASVERMAGRHKVAVANHLSTGAGPAFFVAPHRRPLAAGYWAFRPHSPGICLHNRKYRHFPKKRKILPKRPKVPHRPAEEDQ